MRIIVMFSGWPGLDIFMREILNYFREKQYELLLFKKDDMEQGFRDLIEFVKQPVDAAVTFNNWGFNSNVSSGENMWEFLHIPCINILVDHPFCFHESLLDAPANGRIFCIDRNHVRYIRRFYPQLSQVGFLPHGGIEAAQEHPPIGARGTDVLYMGGLSRKYAEQTEKELADMMDPVLERTAEEVYWKLIREPWRCTEEVMEETLRENDVVLEEDLLREVISCLRYVEQYAVSYYREKVIRTLIENGVHVTLFGDGWEICDWIDHPNLEYGGTVPAEEAVAKMRDAKLVLNTMTWFKDGAHERVFNGILAGAVCVTEASDYIEECFEDGVDAVFFRLHEIDLLPERIRRLLEDPDHMQAIADRGYRKAKAAHTWKHRMEEIGFE